MPCQRLEFVAGSPYCEAQRRPTGSMLRSSSPSGVSAPAKRLCGHLPMTNYMHLLLTPSVPGTLERPMRNLKR